MYGKRKPPRPFYLIKRTGSRKETVYYYRLLNKNYQTIGEWSTGQNSKDSARDHCYGLIAENRLNPLLFKNPEPIKTRPKKDPPKVIFGEYFMDFFDYEKCPHIRERLEAGKTYSRQHSKNQRNQLEKYILPFFQSKPLVSISPPDIKKWRNFIQEEFSISPVTINGITRTLKLMLNFAVNEWIIPVNPAIGMKALGEDKKTRNILSWNEVDSIFHPKVDNSPWYSEIGRTGSLLAACTGMRLSEILALQTPQIKEDHIIVKYAIDPATGQLKTPKNGEARIIPICPELRHELLKITYGREGYVFSRDAGKKPVSSRLLRDQFMETLVNLEILKKSPDGNIENPRNLVFHGWRVWINTMMIFAEIPTAKVQALMGHKSGDRMTDHYSRLTAEGFRMEPMTLLELQQRIIKGAKA